MALFANILIGIGILIVLLIIYNLIFVKKIYLENKDYFLHYRYDKLRKKYTFLLVKPRNRRFKEKLIKEFADFEKTTELFIEYIKYHKNIHSHLDKTLNLKKALDFIEANDTEVISTEEGHNDIELQDRGYLLFNGKQSFVKHFIKYLSK